MRRGERIETHGVRFSGSYGMLRAVTHLDVSAADIDTALSAARQAW